MQESEFFYHEGLLVCRKWQDLGLVHGFAGLPADFRHDRAAASLTALCAKHGLSQLLLPEQTHSCRVIEAASLEDYRRLVCAGQSASPRPEELQGDAIIVQTQADTAGGAMAIGVTTADCVPLLLLTGGLRAVIHAGWRGISSGIIDECVLRLQEAGGSAESLEAVIGPCAGCALYEVGSEVSDCLGDRGVFRRDSDGRLFLDLAASCEQNLRKAWKGQATIRTSRVCTISDKGFHSYRRDGHRSGRNLAFITLGKLLNGKCK